MESLGQLGAWIATNESLLSGIAAIIVVAGVVFTPVGAGLRRFLAGSSSAELTISPSLEAGPREISFADLTAPSAFETRFAQSGPLRIAYNVRGQGPPDLLVTPGIVSHLHVIEHLPATAGTLQGLAAFGRLVAFDKRGQGLSDPTPSAPTLDERCDDMDAVMDAAGLERAILFGCSEGGPMCLQYAVTRPERVQGLVLLGTAARWLQSDEFPQGLPRRSLEALPRAWGTGVLRDVFFPGMSREQMSDETYSAFERIVADRQSIQQIVELILSFDVRHLLPQISVPTLVIHFSGDLAVPIRLGRMLAEGIPGAEFLEVNGVDHADLARSPEAIARVERFCREIDATG